MHDNRLTITAPSAQHADTSTVARYVDRPARDAANGRLDHPRLCDLVLPPDMTGRTVLDVGSGEGDFCFETLRRGAQRALGLEFNANSVSRAQAMATSLRLPAEFRHVDVGAYCPEESFDIVHCSKVLEDVRNPFSLLERLIDLTKDRLIVEVGDIGAPEQKQLNLRWWRRLLFRGLHGLPLVFVNPKPTWVNRRPFYLTKEAVQCLLADRRAVFSRVELIPVPNRHRHILIAHKRRIRRLIVIAGPTSAGKTTLVSNLNNGSAPEVADRLGISDRSTWDSLEVTQIADDPRVELATVVMQHDFLTRLNSNLPDAYMTEFLDVFNSAQELTFLTIWTEPTQLRRQFEENEIREYIRQRGAEPTRPKTLRLRQEYRDPQTILEYYHAWFRFASSIRSTHLVLTWTPTLRICPLSQWWRECGLLAFCTS